MAKITEEILRRSQDTKRQKFKIHKESGSKISDKINGQEKDRKQTASTHNSKHIGIENHLPTCQLKDAQSYRLGL